ncbi:hypothetical protein [uncultured Pelagimonas sp.]|uniref:hypothetical protein n=1 Tax=uncultured Pelagimonas sp. TaxID=1618102 RepID=UPI0026022B4C|nr:hypothetical protein [uncultured Pelagimonas sp.]
MKTVAFALLAVLLTGCSAQVQYKAGGTPAQRNADSASCNRSATAAYPANIVTRRTPRYYRPGYRHCHNGKCRSTGGYWEGGDVYSVDVNKSSRARAYSACMSSTGYQSVELPFCTGETRQKVASSTQSRYPQLTQGSCIVKMQDGTVKVYSP